MHQNDDAPDPSAAIVARYAPEASAVVKRAMSVGFLLPSLAVVVVPHAWTESRAFLRGMRDAREAMVASLGAERRANSAELFHVTTRETSDRAAVVLCHQRVVVAEMLTMANLGVLVPQLAHAPRGFVPVVVFGDERVLLAVVRVIEEEDDDCDEC